MDHQSGKAAVDPALEGISSALAQWISELNLEDVPESVIRHAKLCILDTLGCGLFGSGLEWSRIAADTAAEICPSGPAGIWGRPGLTSGTTLAAMANGTAAHAFEIDDAHTESMLHPGAVVVPAVFALADAEHLSGRSLLTAFIGGYEAGLRIGCAAGTAHFKTGFHPTGTVGAFAASAASARALQLGHAQTLNALGIGGAQASGLYCARDGAMSKRFHAGHAAQAGVMAASLARRGFTGARAILEADVGGFFGTMSDEADTARVLDGLGENWELLKVGFKAYAACASTHTIIDGVDALVKEGVIADNLQQLEIGLTNVGFFNVGGPYRPNGVVAAQMNGRYAAAVRLLEGDVSVAQFREDLLEAPSILGVIDRIAVRHDPELDAGGAAKRHASRVVATLTDGRRIEAFNEQRRGSHHRPLSHAEIVHKFRTTAGSALTPVSVDEVLESVLALETLADTRHLTDLLSGTED